MRLPRGNRLSSVLRLAKYAVLTRAYISGGLGEENPIARNLVQTCRERRSSWAFIGSSVAIRSPEYALGAEETTSDDSSRKRRSSCPRYMPASHAGDHRSEASQGRQFQRRVKGAVHENVISAPEGSDRRDTRGAGRTVPRAASKGRSVRAAAESRKPQPALEAGTNLLELCCLERAQLPEKPGGGHGQRAVNTYTLSKNAICSACSPAACPTVSRHSPISPGRRQQLPE